MHLPPTITTERLTLRAFETGDLEAYVAYYTGPRTDGVGGPVPRHKVVTQFYGMVGQWALHGFGRYAVTRDNMAIGHAGVLLADPKDGPELTWTLWDSAHEGHGYTTEAARAVLHAWQGPPLPAHVAPDNHPSIRVAERLGMTHDPDAPKLTRWPDARVYRREAA